MQRISVHRVDSRVLNRNKLTLFVMSYTPKAYVSKKRDRVKILHCFTHSSRIMELLDISGKKIGKQKKQKRTNRI